MNLFVGESLNPTTSSKPAQMTIPISTCLFDYFDWFQVLKRSKNQNWWIFRSKITIFNHIQIPCLHCITSQVNLFNNTSNTGAILSSVPNNQFLAILTMSVPWFYCRLFDRNSYLCSSFSALSATFDGFYWDIL